MSFSSEGQQLLVVRLTDSGRRELHAFTSLQLGERVSIVHGDDKLISTEVLAPVSSGVLIANDLQEGQVEQMLERLLYERRKAPCGGSGLPEQKEN